MASNARSVALAAAYQERVVAIADRTQRAARGLVVVDPDDPAASWQRILEQVTQLVSAAQSASSTLALGYFRAMGTLELGAPPELGEVRPNNIGFTEDGRSITDALGAPRGRFFKKLDEGLDFADLVPETIESVGRMAQFEVMDAGQRELAHQVAQSDQAQGWRSRSRGTCGACLALDNGSNISRRPPFHPHCVCVMEIDFGTDDEVTRPTGAQRFDALPSEQQNDALGFEKAELLRRRLISWDDLVAINTFKEWTPVITEAPLESLLAIAGVTVEQLQSL